MVLDVSITQLKVDENDIIDAVPALPPGLYDLFTVHVDSTRILTVLTDEGSVASNWLTSVLRSKSTNKPPPPPPRHQLSSETSAFPPDTIFVGLVAEEMESVFGPRPYDAADHCFDLLSIYVGAHCLLLELYGGKYYPRFDAKPPFLDSPRLVKAFFSNPRVVVVGTDVADLTRRLEARHGIRFHNPAVDLNQLAVKALTRKEHENLDLARYGFGKLTMTVMGKEYDVIKPEPVWWYPREAYRVVKGKGFRLGIWSRMYYGMLREKIMFNTVDAHLRLIVCFKLLDEMDGPDDEKKKTKKSKKKSEKGGRKN